MLYTLIYLVVCALLPHIWVTTEALIIMAIIDAIIVMFLEAQKTLRGNKNE